jgi:regulator of protease activity HflC (stomatin/prohibitin superfamily)
MMKQIRSHGRKGFNLLLLEQFYNLLEGDLIWAERRVMLIVTAALALVLMGRATEQITQWWQMQAIVDPLPGPVRFVLSLVHPQTLRHIIPPVLGVVAAMLMTSNYVRDLFELPDLNAAYRYVAAAMFGWDYPSINVKGSGYEGADKIKVGSIKELLFAEVNPILKIGGPGYVSIAPGSVALFERVGGPSKVAGSGLHFIRRFETLREVIDLRDQFRTRDEVKALTKDGIAVGVQNVQVSFRVRTSNRPRTHREAYPFSVSAVKRIAYGKTVSAKGPSTWSESVPNAVVGNIRNYIGRTLLDDLVARSEGDSKDPREKIKSMFDHKDMRKRFHDMGVELLWVSLGHIKTPHDVLTQRLLVWGAEWERQAHVKVSEAEAHKLRLMEYAKAMARVEMIETMVKGLPAEVADPHMADVVVINWLEALNIIGRKIGASSDPIREIIMSAERLKNMMERPLLPKGESRKGKGPVVDDPPPPAGADEVS